MGISVGAWALKLDCVSILISSLWNLWNSIGGTWLANLAGLAALNSDKPLNGLSKRFRAN